MISLLFYFFICFCLQKALFFFFLVSDYVTPIYTCKKIMPLLFKMFFFEPDISQGVVSLVHYPVHAPLAILQVPEIDTALGTLASSQTAIIFFPVGLCSVGQVSIL